MVLPLFDDNSNRRLFPYVNYVLIALNVLVFLGPQRMGTAEGAWFTSAFSVVPERIVTGDNERHVLHFKHPVTDAEGGDIVLESTPGSVYLTLLTSMFMHGGWAHLLGNMLFLWIFGDNVEDYLGRVRYLIFYLTCGVFASLAHVFSTYITHHDPFIPCLGASGAISGVLGGYLVLFPNNPVTVILFRFLTQVPAYVAIGMWFVFQIINGLGSLGDETGGGVAYAAHVGGFLIGMIQVKAFALGQDMPAWRSQLKDDDQPPRRFRRTPWA
jgi:membrane associated rhomboid family serine protease